MSTTSRVKPGQDGSLARRCSRRARVGPSLFILFLALISLTLLQLHQNGFWLYTSLMCVFVALFCIVLGTKNNLTFFRLLLYWIGFLMTLYLDALLLRYGVTTHVQTGLFALILLAATLFFTGITYEIAFSLVGLTIAAMIIGSLMIHDNVLFAFTPLAIIGIMFFLMKEAPQKKLSKSNQQEML